MLIDVFELPSSDVPKTFRWLSVKDFGVHTQSGPDECSGRKVAARSGPDLDYSAHRRNGGAVHPKPQWSDGVYTHRSALPAGYT